MPLAQLPEDAHGHWIISEKKGGTAKHRRDRPVICCLYGKSSAEYSDYAGILQRCCAAEPCKACLVCVGASLHPPTVFIYVSM